MEVAGNFHTMDLSGWSVFSPDGRDEMCTTNVSEAPRSPRHLHKRRRLSRLLDKLTVQLKNNNHYPNWPKKRAMPVDVPLDLSVKPKSPPNVAYSCDACGQTFTVHDRLTKHVASLHRNRVPENERVYECDICQRRFARSDMLTRHARLHSGLKPYSCPSCDQVFSRSDHLATHIRTHTGEKPYSCSLCPYAACRRDMITRHMRTHSRRPRSPPASPPSIQSEPRRIKVER